MSQPSSDSSRALGSSRRSFLKTTGALAGASLAAESQARAAVALAELPVVGLELPAQIGIGGRELVREFPERDHLLAWIP